MIHGTMVEIPDYEPEESIELLAQLRLLLQKIEGRHGDPDVLRRDADDLRRKLRELGAEPAES
jgi:hypothetical protein